MLEWDTISSSFFSSLLLFFDRQNHFKTNTAMMQIKNRNIVIFVLRKHGKKKLLQNASKRNHDGMKETV